MSTLATAISDVRKRIKQAGKRGLNEQNTKASLIEPVLRALGWDTEDFDEVAREFKTKARDKPVDYGLLLMRTPRLFVEAKALGQNLDDKKWANQIMGYAAVAGVEWIVLTDGNEYRIYNAHALVHVEEKLFRRIVVDSEDPLVQPTLELLARDLMEENRLQVYWRAEFVDRQVRGALEKVFTGDGDLLIVNYVASHTKDLSPDEIRESLRRCRATFDFPVPSEPPVLKPKWKQPKGRPTHQAGDVSLAQILEAGILAAPVKLERTYKGQHLTATIEKDGQVRFEKKRYASPSMAAGMARASIIGTNPKGQPPATNGWTFWRLRNAEGKSTPLDSARQQFQTLRRSQAAG